MGQRHSFWVIVTPIVATFIGSPAKLVDQINKYTELTGGFEISSLQVNAGDPDYVASIVFDRLVYGLHPYGKPGSGTPESLAGVTRDDLHEFHRRQQRVRHHDRRKPDPAILREFQRGL